MQTSWRNGSLIRLFSRNPQVGAGITWQSRSYASGFSPLGWVRDKLSPQLREKQTKEEIAEAKKRAAEEGNRSVFEGQPTVLEKSVKDGKGFVLANKRNREKLVKAKEHKYSTANFNISHRKLNMLANQISGKPVDWAILQMQFSEKRASTRIMNMLATARDHAIRYKRMNRPKLIVSEAWVTKGPRANRQVEPRGRNHFGIRERLRSKMTVVLRHGYTVEEKKAQRREKILKRIVSAGVRREDVPLRNPSPTWCW